MAVKYEERRGSAGDQRQQDGTAVERLRVTARELESCSGDGESGAKHGRPLIEPSFRPKRQSETAGHHREGGEEVALPRHAASPMRRVTTRSTRPIAATRAMPTSEAIARADQICTVWPK
jgi:hypothetical protein